MALRLVKREYYSFLNYNNHNSNNNKNRTITIIINNLSSTIVVCYIFILNNTPPLNLEVKRLGRSSRC